MATITDVAERHLCTGCGACAYVQPDDITMVDDLDAGRRPLVREGTTSSRALAACPGAELEHPPTHPPGAIEELLGAWGPVLGVWEGHALDPEVRRSASSGGIASALALHCMEAEAMHGVLHIRQRADAALLNETTLSTTREELLAATGSRYAPASPCDGLQMVVDAPGECVMIGKPCDVAATRRVRDADPALDAKLGFTIAMFCAGTPSTRGTMELVRRLGLELGDVRSVRYRGNGWPGDFVVVAGDGEHEQVRSLSYAESWNFLQRYRQWRCSLCADHTGEFADVAVGDPWYRETTPDQLGSSLILARSPRGRDVLLRAAEAGAIQLRPLAPSRLVDAQPNLLATRGAVWGRVLVSRAGGVVPPRYRRIPTFGTWWSHLPPKAKVRSLTGTARRLVSKRLYRRRPVVAATVRSGEPLA
ncbi:MAG: coenzyme F420 hydrogenase [Acidimicrobiia bacterium]|nr:coenzyme F420 hydrogenase [Acidimicrobiia bacterium]